ncbi:MAG TPA: hypothetical protein VII94_03780 [Candidatus Saccharimonadales bacterium]
MKNLISSKICTQCKLVKLSENFRKNKAICRSCERLNDRQRCSGDRFCTNCHIFKLEDEFDKYARHCKECKSQYNKNKIINLRDDPNQTEYLLYLEKNSKNNVKRHLKREEKFNSLPIEDCYEEYLAILRKNANSRATKAKIVCDIDLPFLINLYDQQNGKCSLTGIKFNLDKSDTSAKRPFAPSIDRINCNEGYTKNNVRLVLLVVNLALNDFGDSVFDAMCRGYIKHNS